MTTRAKLPKMFQAATKTRRWAVYVDNRLRGFCTTQRHAEARVTKLLSESRWNERGYVLELVTVYGSKPVPFVDSFNKADVEI